MKQKTIIKTIVGVVVIGGALGCFIYYAMRSSWSYYCSVDDFSARVSEAGRYSFRVAGKVKPGSADKDLQNMTLTFTLAGSESELPVRYRGAVPENFAEGRDVVVEGRLSPDGVFLADKLMTRCESKYRAKLK